MTPAAPRIVSLLASGTEIVDALGLGECLVGISHECDHPPHLLDRPRVSRPRFDPDALSSGEIDAAVRQAMAEHGSVYEVDAAVLEKLQPDIIITQAVCDVCAVPTDGVREVLGARGIEAEVVSLDAHTIDEILASVTQVARAAGSPEIAREAGGSLRSRLDAVRAAVRDAVAPRVLGIEWFDPPFAPGHWVPEMIELAGGRNLVGEAGQPSREVSWDEMGDLDPDALLLMPCGYGIEAARDDADVHSERLRKVAPRAIAEGRAWVVDASSYFNRSGPRFVTGVEILGGLLHPDRRPTPDATVAAVWSPPA
ncbi:cobalamin-binding protein [Candidatus Palauibacter sp.]|uniref:cobalamin-binding protein n=1 Tax=Candidatus Palauibacter sp. TaxID=3101350 RepID=UPI003B5C2709